MYFPKIPWKFKIEIILKGRYSLIEQIQNYIKSLNAISENKIKTCQFDGMDQKKDLEEFIFSFERNVSSIDPAILETTDLVELFDSKNIYNMY